MPSFQAVTIMFCAQRPASNSWRSVCAITTTTAALASHAAYEPKAAIAARRSRSRTTTRRFGSRFFELPVMRAACRMRRSASSGIGFGRNAR
jgi:hypothetical protein